MSNDNIGCFGWVLQLLGIIPKDYGTKKEIFPYAKREDFLSPAEFTFFKILVQAIDDKAIVCPKVSLKDIFFVNTKDRSNYMIYHNKINLKHVDFLLCNPNNMRPICGIELDDSSHQKTDRIERDNFVNNVFKTAGIELLRFEAKRGYSVSEVKQSLDSLFNTDNNIIVVEEQQPVIQDEKAPICPNCGIEMVLRTSSKGDNKGKSFYGCPNFPKCRRTIQI